MFAGGIDSYKDQENYYTPYMHAPLTLDLLFLLIERERERDGEKEREFFLLLALLQAIMQT